MKLPELFNSDKALSLFPGWTKPEEETQYTWFDAPIEIGGVTQAGLSLHGGCYADKPECNVTFELRIARTPGKHCLPLGRIDWRALCGGHSNPRRPLSPYAGLRLPPTHYHDFELNWLESESRMRAGSLKVARPIEEDLQKFENVRAYAGKVLRISNMELVTTPEWQARLV